MLPTDKQLQVISFIEKNIPYVKFVGKTKMEAAEFISDNLEKSRVQRRSRQNAAHRHHTSYRNTFSQQRRERSDERHKSDYDRYEEYIERVSGAYADLAGDGWGGFEAKEIARKLTPFEEWKWL